MGLTDAIRSYLSAPHSVFHHVTSMNDFGSHAAEELDEAEAALQSGMASEKVTEQPAQLGRTASNKHDDWPAFETRDIHKVNVSVSQKDKRHLYDHVSGPNRGPSVWEHIIKGEQHRDAMKSKDQDGERRVNMASSAPSASAGAMQAMAKTRSSLDQPRNTTGVMSHHHVTGNTDSDYTDMLSHYGSE